jgi:hypothetical protein
MTSNAINNSAPTQEQIQNIYKRVRMQSCSWCNNECDGELSLVRDSLEWCQVIRENVTTLTFCSYDCRDELACNNFREGSDDIRERGDDICNGVKTVHPQQRRCVECASKCSETLDVEGKYTTEGITTIMSFCDLSCYSDFADRRMVKDFNAGTI